jgi:hypothetical protein
MFVFGMGFRADSRSFLKPAVNGFKSLKRVQELKAHFSHLLCMRSKFLGVLDGKPDPVDGDTHFVRHLEVHGCGPGL